MNTPIQQETYTFRLPLSHEKKMKTALQAMGFSFHTIAHAFWQATLPSITITFFTSGTLCLQGKEVLSFIDSCIEKGIIPLPTPDHHFPAWIGTDESGKGDYFGPLVIAGVMLTPAFIPELFRIGIRDSKDLSDRAIATLVPSIQQYCPYSVVIIHPPKYNSLIEKMHNLNALLAWGHARVIENILEKHTCAHVISDQFGDPRFIQNALLKKGKTISLTQRPRAEEDLAVAAASILARHSFVEQLALLSRKYQLPLAKGASLQVIAQAKEFVRKFGMNQLGEIAKLHFKTTEKVVLENK